MCGGGGGGREREEKKGENESFWEYLGVFCGVGGGVEVDSEKDKRQIGSSPFQCLVI